MLKRKYIPASILALIVVVAVSAQAQEDYGFVQLGSWVEGPNGAVTADGDIVYLGNGNYLEVVDFADPNHAFELTRIELPSSVSDIKLVGNRAFLSTEKHAVVVDISNPSSLSIIATYETSFYGTDPWGASIDVKDDVVVWGGRQFVLLLQFDGQRLTRLATYPDLDCIYDGTCVSSYPLDVVVRDNYAYIGHAGVDVIDLSDPHALSRVGRYVNWDIEGGGKIALKGDRLILASDSYLRFFDISDPTNPVKTDSLRVSESWMWRIDIEWVGNHLICGEDRRLIVVDVTPGQSPSVVWEQPTRSFTGMAASGSKLYVSHKSWLQLFDVTEPGAPSEGYIFPTGWESEEWDHFEHLVVKDSEAFFWDSGYGLRIVDVSIPAAPTAIGHYYLPAPTPTVQIDVVDDFVYVTSVTSIRVIDVSDPRNPFPTAFVNTAGGNVALTVLGDWAYLSKQHWGVEVLDISDPSFPLVVNRISDTDLTFCILANDGRQVYLVQDEGPLSPDVKSLFVCDVSAPQSPAKIGSLSLFDLEASLQGLSMYPSDIAASNGYVYLAAQELGLRVVDAKDAFSPVEIARFGGGEGEYAIRVGATNKLVFMLSRDRFEGTLKAINVSNPHNPIEVGSVTSDLYKDLEVIGRRVYTLSQDRLTSWDFRPDKPVIEPEIYPILTRELRSYKPQLHQNFPNPFNPATTISFVLPNDDFVNLTIFDVGGRRVRTLIDRRLGDGPQSISWDGTDVNGKPVPSGVYFYRLRAGDFVETRKMTLLN